MDMADECQPNSELTSALDNSAKLLMPV